ncbi:MAG: rhodanese-like domain-containing protein [Gammaproteobacteria bacterium]
MIKEISPLQAWEILQSDPKAVLLDVRSSMEYEYVGHPPNAINIPWKEPPEWNVDPDFTDKVRDALQQSCLHDGPIEGLPVLAICRSGQRSRAAGEALLAQGFTRVYNIVEGFEGDRNGDKQRGALNGWRFHNLPWEQS